MKIVAKRCPSCGADLDFAYGDHDVECKACRHKYAIEYEDGHVQVEAKKHSGFGVTTEQALEAMEMFSRVFEGGQIEPSGGDVVARRVTMGLETFRRLTDKGLTPEMIFEKYPGMEFSIMPETNEAVFMQYYENPVHIATLDGDDFQLYKLRR